jgi:hypothetical protein
MRLYRLGTTLTLELPDGLLQVDALLLMGFVTPLGVSSSAALLLAPNAAAAPPLVLAVSLAMDCLRDLGLMLELRALALLAAAAATPCLTSSGCLALLDGHSFAGTAAGCLEGWPPSSRMAFSLLENGLARRAVDAAGLPLLMPCWISIGPRLTPLRRCTGGSLIGFRMRLAGTAPCRAAGGLVVVWFAAAMSSGPRLSPRPRVAGACCLVAGFSRWAAASVGGGG